MTSRWLFRHNLASRGTNQPIRKSEFVQCIKFEEWNMATSKEYSPGNESLWGWSLYPGWCEYGFWRSQLLSFQSCRMWIVLASSDNGWPWTIKVIYSKWEILWQKSSCWTLIQNCFLFYQKVIFSVSIMCLLAKVFRFVCAGRQWYPTQHRESARYNDNTWRINLAAYHLPENILEI